MDTSCFFRAPFAHDTPPRRDPASSYSHRPTINRPSPSALAVIQRHQQQKEQSWHHPYCTSSAGDTLHTHTHTQQQKDHQEEEGERSLVASQPYPQGGPLLQVRFRRRQLLSDSRPAPHPSWKASRNISTRRGTNHELVGIVFGGGDSHCRPSSHTLRERGVSGVPRQTSRSGGTLVSQVVAEDPPQLYRRVDDTPDPNDVQLLYLPTKVVDEDESYEMNSSSRGRGVKGQNQLALPPPKTRSPSRKVHNTAVATSVKNNFPQKEEDRQLQQQEAYLIDELKHRQQRHQSDQQQLAHAEATKQALLRQLQALDMMEGVGAGQQGGRPSLQEQVQWEEAQDGGQRDTTVHKWLTSQQ